MKVVLSGYYGFHNVGDEAILFSMIRALREVDSTVEITVLSNDPAFTEATYGVKAVNRWKMKEVAAALRSSDGLISGGGSLLQDKTGVKSVIYYTGVMFLAKMLGKPVFIYAQGMGPLEGGLSRWLTKVALQKVNAITVRDEESKALLEEIGVRGDIELVPDPVLGLRAEEFDNSWFQEQNFSRPVITVSVRDWPSEIDYEKEIALSLDQIAGQGYEIVFIPMHGQDDDVTSRRVAQLMECEAIVAPYDMSIEEKIGLIKLSELVVAMRLHALIFAAVTHVPFVALSYDPKIDSFCKQSEQPVAGHVNVKLDSAALVAWMEQQLENRDAEAGKLVEFMQRAHPLAVITAEKALKTCKLP